MTENLKIFPDGRLTARDTAKYLGLSYKTLACHRSAGFGPKFIKLGKAVFYRKADLDEWLASCHVASTAEYRAKARGRRLTP